MRLTVRDIVQNISLLNTNQDYSYVNPTTKGKIRIISATLPEGPIEIKRYKALEGETLPSVGSETISSNMIKRIANAFVPGRPINFDRVLAGSYNTRSVLEALMAACPNFFYCVPGRLEYDSSGVSIKPGHKHLVWLPEESHTRGEIVKKDLEGVVISEIATEEVIYDELQIPASLSALFGGANDETIRLHLQMQINLIIIGQHMRYKTWIAQNDRGIMYQGKKLGEMEDVLQALNTQNLISSNPDAIKAARLIDVIWFRNGKYIPAVMEVEHSTGVVSGLSRMKGLKEQIPSIQTRYVIIAPDEDRDKVVRHANEPQFKDLQARFLPYSALEELRWFCEKHQVNGLEDRFIDYYLEKIVEG